MQEVLSAAKPIQEAAREQSASTGPSLQEPGGPLLADSKVSSAAPRSPMLDPKEGREGSQLAKLRPSDVRPALPVHDTPPLLEESSRSGKSIQGLEEVSHPQVVSAPVASEEGSAPGDLITGSPRETGAAPFPTLGTVVTARPITPSAPDRAAILPRGPDPESGEPADLLASVSRAPEPPAVPASAPPIQQGAPQQSMSQEAPPSAVAKALPEPAPSTGVDHAGFPSPGTMIAGGSSAPDRIPSGSPEGRGFGRLAVRLDGPRSRVTDHEIEAVSGKILGGVPVELALHVNGTAREVVADGGSFQVSVSLQRGPNLLRVVAKDWQGIKTEDSIAVTYVPPPVPNGIVITGPGDGYILPSDAPPVILVEGRIEDWNVSTVWLVANGRRIAVPAHDGRFHKALPALDRVLHLWAELPASNGSTHRSRSVTVRNPSPSRSHGLLLLDWPEGVVGNQVEMKATWRESPARLDVPIRGVPIQVFGTSTKETLPEVFSLRMKPGVYTFVLRARGMSASGVRATLILPQGGHLKGRELKPVSLNGAREVVLAKVLLPQGVLWGDDEWFTGQSESADSVTKFRFPEGISWTERKKDLQ